MKKFANRAKLLAPNTPIIYTTIGDAYFDKKMFKEAKNNYESLLNLAPDWYILDEKICRQNAKCRLFTKHARRLNESMKNFEWIVENNF